jgi:5'-3' exonuclease
MGIKNLNKFITTECSNAIKQIGLTELSGKKIVIDISIYIFKYSIDGCLIENMYLMLSLFINYNIIPIFIFDGKRPNEKKELLDQRRDDRDKLKHEYDLLKCKLDTDDDLQDDEKQEIISNLRSLNNKLVIIKKSDFENVKKLITAFGCMYFDAPGEADELCSFLCIKGKVWGCLSEDMDMFVYGCPRVIRHLSLLNNSAVLYDNKEILNTLRITQPELREICVLSGTDYNIKVTKSVNLYQSLNLFKRYKKSKKTDTFYAWVADNTKFIEDDELLIKINKMFALEDDAMLTDFEQLPIKRGSSDITDINTILMKDGFIFPV